METIKDIHDKTGACFLLVGNPAAERVLERDGQIRRRFDDVIYLPAYDWTDQVQAGEFCSVCKSLWRAMGIPVDPLLEENIVLFCERLYFVSTGIIGELIKLLSKAEEIRIFEEKPIIDAKVFYQAVNTGFALHKREFSDKASLKENTQPIHSLQTATKKTNAVQARLDGMNRDMLVHLTPRPSEFLAAYLLRVAHANGYQGLQASAWRWGCIGSLCPPGLSFRPCPISGLMLRRTGVFNPHGGMATNAVGCRLEAAACPFDTGPLSDLASALLASQTDMT